MRPPTKLAAALAASLAVLAVPATASAHNTGLPDVIHAWDESLHPEGITYDPTRGSFLVSSERHGTVSLVAPDGEVTTFIDDPELVSTYGMRVDARNGLVYVTDGDLGFGVDTNLETPTAGLAVYDLETGERVRYSDLDVLVPDGAAHSANDVAVAPDGTAYVTDPVAGLVFEVEPDGDASLFIDDPKLTTPGGFGANGIVYRDGKLIIGNYSSGSLWTVDVDEPETVEEIEITTQDGVQLIGLDGLAWDGRTLVAVTNSLSGQGTDAVHRFRLDWGWNEAKEVSVQLSPEQPTTITVANCRVYTVFGDLAALRTGEGTPRDDFFIRGF